MKITKQRFDRILNIAIVICTFWAVSVYFYGPPDILGGHDVKCFKYFTTDSNILAACGSLLWLCYGGKGEGKILRRVTAFKFAGTVAVTVTLLTVIFFLAPMSAVNGKGLASAAFYFKGNVFVLHLSTPVLAIISDIFLERKEPLTKKHALLGILPVLLYSFVYVTMVVFLKWWPDWYGFTFGGRLWVVPIVMLVMYGFSAALSLALWKIKRK